MVPPEGPDPEIHGDFRNMLPADVPITRQGRREFYGEVRSDDTALVIATGEQRVWANIMLTIGVVKPA
jgi:L-fucose mutarotase